jgi:hypothetical protein
MRWPGFFAAEWEDIMNIHRRSGSPVLAGVLLAGICLTVTAGPAAAQGWLEKAKSVFGAGKPAARADSGLSEAEIGSGLKEALLVGTGRVVDRLGTVDGFNADPRVHIPLPGSLKKVQSTLDAVGMASMLDDLELRMNRAAEAATPRAKALFVQAIEGLTLDDVMNIYRGPDDAATRYFQGKMSAQLGAEMRPIVDGALADAGAVKAYDSAMARYEAVPFAPKVKTDLTGYVVEQGMDGIFSYLASEEAAIRKDPVSRTTELLKRVFGGG